MDALKRGEGWLRLGIEFGLVEALERGQGWWELWIEVQVGGGSG